jgi:hypothetical protein
MQWCVSLWLTFVAAEMASRCCSLKKICRIRCRFYLFSLDAGNPGARRLVTTLTDSIIGRKDLLRLAGMVQLHNDKARKLFDVGA